MIVGLPLAAHFAVRRLAPHADGMLLPLASLLNGLGYVFIVRLDEAKAEPDGLAGLQSVWMVLGVAAFFATLIVVRDARKLERYRYTAGFVGLVLLLLPLLPVVGREINGSRIWVSFGPVNFQPGEFAKLCLAVFFAGYLVEKRELLAVNRAFGPIALPDPKHLGPVLIAWGVALVVMIMEKDLGTSLLFFTLFLVMIWVATERASYLAVGVAHVRGRRLPGVQRLRPRAGALRHLARPVGQGQGVPGRCRRCSPSPTAASSAPGSNLGVPLKIPVVESDMIFAAIGEELGLLGGDRGAHRLPADDRRRPAHRPADGQRLRAAAGHRPDHPARVPGVHHHGRGHPAAAAHRRDAAVRVVRRLVAAGQLGAAGAAAAHLRTTRPSATPTGWRPEQTDRRMIGRPAMSKQIRNLGVFLAVCYVALFLQVNRLTVFEAEALQDKPQNTRAVERDFSSPRGDIVSADGVVLAESVPSDDRFELQRTYPPTPPSCSPTSPATSPSRSARPASSASTTAT